jgi:hypothetical protein
MNTKSIRCLKDIENTLLKDKSVQMFIVVDGRKDGVRFATKGNALDLGASIASAIYDNPDLLSVFKNAIKAYENVKIDDAKNI